jgi:hypothetical protein
LPRKCMTMASGGCDHSEYNLFFFTWGLEERSNGVLLEITSSEPLSWWLCWMEILLFPARSPNKMQ